MLISLSNIKKVYNGSEILGDCTFDINDKDRLGLVGLNGSGKTTILKIIKGMIGYDSGDVFIKKDIKIGYLDQIPVYKGTVTEVLHEAFKKIYEAEKNLQKLEKEINKDPDNKRLLTLYGHKQHEFIDMDGYNTETQLKMIIKGLKISENLLTHEFMALSGGEKSRVVLAKTLLEKPDVLLLDEPSNHLDMESISFLENFLQSYDGAVLIISHDRYLLDKVCNKIVDLENSKTKTYRGNYTKYLEEKKLYVNQLISQYEAQQKKIKHLEEQITRYKLYAKMGGGAKMDIKAKDRAKKLAKIDKVYKPTDERTIKLNINKTVRTSKVLIKFTNYAKHFEDKQLVDNFNYTVYSKDRAFIIGKNGTGKTTLFKSILKEESYDGDIFVARSAKIGYLSQEIQYSDPDRTVLHELQFTLDTTETDARNKLAQFLFIGDDVFKQVRNISGGEKAKLELCKIVNQDYNTLFLDEPTNHLDIESKEALELALKNYDGTLLVISHDRYFIKKLAGYILELEDKKITKYEDSFDEVFEKVPEPKKVQKLIKSQKKQGLSNNKIREHEKQLDKIMEQLDKIKSLYNKELASDACNYSKIKEYLDKQEELEMEYFEISEIIEENK